MMLFFPFCLLDPDWYHVRSLVRQQKRRTPRKDEDGWYYLTLLQPGEDVLYTDAAGSTYVPVHVRPPYAIYTPSIKRWRFGRKMTEAERARVIRRMTRYFTDDGLTCELIDDTYQR